VLEIGFFIYFNPSKTQDKSHSSNNTVDFKIYGFLLDGSRERGGNLHNVISTINKLSVKSKILF